MDIRKLQKIAVTALDDIKGEDIEVINTSKLSSLFDRIIIATGTSNRQVRSLARNVHDKVKEAGGTVIGIEGEDSGEWVLVDLADIVVHVMQPAVRAHYKLEELWTARPARVSAGEKVSAADTAAAAPPKPRARPRKAVAAAAPVPAGGDSESAPAPARCRSAAVKRS